MTPSNIIDAVRIRLGDATRERWGELQLLLYVSLAQNVICTVTHFYRKDDWIPLVDDQLIYDLPSDCLVVNRLEYNEYFFPIESRNAIDRGQAVFPCALKDNLAYNKLEIVLEAPGGESNTTLSQAMATTYGKGPTTQELGPLHVYYSAVPPMISDINQELVLPDAYFTAFFHYVTGMALQDDNDANNIQRGEMELQKFERVVADIYKKSAKDYTSNIKSKLTTPRRI